MRFCVIRHPDLENLGTSPESALDIHRAKGWYRVSDWRSSADLFHFPDFADATEDLDQPAQEEPQPGEQADEQQQTSPPETEPTTATRKNSKEKSA